MRSWKNLFVGIILIVLVLGLAGCQARPEGPSIKVEEPWSRPTPAEAMMGAFYMNISNQGMQSDKLTGAQAEVCGSIELHESYMDANNVMGMRPVEGGYIEIPAGGKVELKPGGMHMMCIGKKGEFTVGGKIPLALTFETSGEIIIEAEVRQP